MWPQVPRCSRVVSRCFQAEGSCWDLAGYREEVASAQKALAALDSAAAAADMRQQQRQARDLLKQQKQQQRQEEKQGAAASNTSKGAPDNDGSPSEAADGAAGGSRQREMDDFGNFDDGSGVSSSGDSGSNIDSSSDSEPFSLTTHPHAHVHEVQARGVASRGDPLGLPVGPQPQVMWSCLTGSRSQTNELQIMGPKYNESLLVVVVVGHCPSNVIGMKFIGRGWQSPSAVCCICSFPGSGLRLRCAQQQSQSIWRHRPPNFLQPCTVA